MNRPLFRPTLDPTREELGGFLIWLVVVVVSMAAMILYPPFHLVFWPTLWIYDRATAKPLRDSLDPDADVSAKIPTSLWDRELDG